MRAKCLGIALALVGSTLLPHEVAAQTSPTQLGATATQTTAPYYFVGRIASSFGTAGYYIATGTVIRPRSAITAAHILYDADYGWGTNIYFERGLYDATRLSLTRPSSKLVMSGYTSAVTAPNGGVNSTRAFTRDFGALGFSSYPANGNCVGYWANPTLLNGTYTTMSLGYGGVNHNGAQLLKCAPPLGVKNAYYPILASFYGNNSFVIEGGMSGGPIFAKSGNTWYVAGVNVAGNATQMAIHALRTEENQIITTYLK